MVCNMETELETISLGCLFTKRHTKYKDTYLKYIQFHFLHKIYHMKLCQMRLKESSICGICKIEKDSVEHMLFDCEISMELWCQINEWIVELGWVNYNLSNIKYS